MAKVTIKESASSYQALGRIMKSDALADRLEEIAKPALEAAQQDPNERYVESLEMRRFVSSGRRGRVSIQIGAAAHIGANVEAKRGTLARALGSAGL